MKRITERVLSAFGASYLRAYKVISIRDAKAKKKAKKEDDSSEEEKKRTPTSLFPGHPMTRDALPVPSRRCAWLPLVLTHRPHAFCYILYPPTYL